MTKYIIENSGTSFVLNGRLEQTLDRLIVAGPRGLTSGELEAGLRLSAYIEKLRTLFRQLLKAEDAIVTTRERAANGANFGRYTLQIKVKQVGRHG